MSTNLRIIRMKIKFKMQKSTPYQSIARYGVTPNPTVVRGKMQNDNAKLKINKIQTPVIARSEATKQSF